MYKQEGDQIGFDIIDKHSSTSHVRLNEAQIQASDLVNKFGIQKIIEGQKYWVSRVNTELYVFILERVCAEKPFRMETNGILHKTSVNECLNREMSYVSTFSNALSLWIFSKIDPRTVEKRKELLAKLKKKIRIASKAKRIRVDQVENSAVHNLERKREQYKQQGYRTEDGSFIGFKVSITDQVSADEYMATDEEEEVHDEDYMGTFANDDVRYLAKLKQGHEECRLYPEEKTSYPFLLSKMTWPKHTLIEMPIMPSSYLCHGLDDVSKNQLCMYSSGGNFVYMGREHPWILTYRARYSSNTLYSTQDFVQNCSAHPISKLRSSSSTLNLIWGQGKKKTIGTEHMKWEIPYSEEIKVPWVVLFKACGILDHKTIASMARFAIKHYFRSPSKQKSIPWDRVDELIQWSLENQDDQSKTIESQEDAWVYIGKLSDKDKDDDFGLDLLDDPDCKDHEQQMKEIKQEKLSVAIKKHNKRKQTHQTYYQQQQPYQPKVPRDPIKDQYKEWIRRGRTTLCKEILPHVGCHLPTDDLFWKPKALELAKMSAKLILDKVKKYTPDPNSFFVRENRDEVANRCIQTLSEWFLNNLLRGTLTSHIQMAKRECIAAIQNDKPLDINGFFNHVRPSKCIDNAIATGIMRSRQHPALAASHAKAGRRVQAPDARHRRTNGGGSAGSVVSKHSKDRTGITQVQNNTNLFSIWSIQSRISGNATNGGVSGAREISDHLGVIDFTETPDNKLCGIVFPHALLARVSIEGIDTQTLLEHLIRTEYKLYDAEYIVSRRLHDNDDDDIDLSNYIDIYINDRFIGMLEPSEAKRLSTFCKRHRFELMGDAFLSVINPVDTKRLDLCTIAGRMVRVLLVVSKVLQLLGPTSDTNPRPLFTSLTWDEMLSQGFLEYIDKREESSDTLILKNINDMIKLGRMMERRQETIDEGFPFTHCEVKPVFILGLCSSQIVFASMNQGPRNVYASSMIKQAMGTEIVNSSMRLDTLMHSLTYAGKPLVYSETLQWFRADSCAIGQQWRIVILSSKETVEDATCVNGDSVALGIGRSTQTAVMTLTEKRTNSLLTSEQFHKCNRNTTLFMKTASYEHLDVDGAPWPGTMITDKEIVISRSVPIENEVKHVSQQIKRYDNSLVGTKKNAGEVTKVYFTTNGRGERKFRVQLEQVCKLGKSDKVSGKDAQKNIISEVCPGIDFVRCQDGLTYDAIFNPHGIPSRMTIAKIVEPLASSVAIEYGNLMNGTSFGKAWKKAFEVASEDTTSIQETGCADGNPDLSLEDEESVVAILGKALERRGLRADGTKIFYNSMTGERMGTFGCEERGAGRIFSGSCYYLKLVHLGNKKCHARSKGPRHILTRQPNEGGSKSGGYRLGEMEKMCLIVYGAALLLKERHLLCSDPFSSHICAKCGTNYPPNLKDQYFYCHGCNTSDFTGQAVMSYGFKLLYQTLQAACLFPRYTTRRIA